MNDDAKLLQRYAVDGDEGAFHELVQGHLGLVFGTAVRLVHDPVLAEDVTQTVFIDLARHAHNWDESAVMAGWLYRATRFASAKAVRSEQRRRQREADYALGVHGADGPAPADDRPSVNDQLDEAIGELSEPDRNALVLRFFQSLDFTALGAVLKTSDDTAQKRVSRALDRLRLLLAERGVALSVATLATLLTQSAQAVSPPNLAVHIAGEVARGAAAGGGGLPFSLTKALVVASAAAVAVSLLSGGFLIGWYCHRALEGPLASDRQPNGLVASWTGDGHARDESGHHDAFVQGNVTYAPGVVGQAFQFDGVEGTRLVVPDEVSLNLTGAITLACWVRPDEDSAMGSLVTKREENIWAVNTGNPANYGLQMNPVETTEQWGIAQYFNDVNVQGGYHLIEPHNGTNHIASQENLIEQLAFFPTPRRDLSVILGQWHHLASTFRQLQPDQVEMAIYFDGRCQGRQLVPGSLANARTGAPLCIGGFPATWFKGRIDEIRLYDRALADLEIQGLVKASSTQGQVGQQAAAARRR